MQYWIFSYLFIFFRQKETPKMTEHTNLLTQIKSIKSEVQHILTPAKLGLTTNEIIKDYLDFTTEQTFPNHDFGFINPDDFLKSEHFRDVLEFKNGKWHALDNEKTRHIRKFVKEQRSGRNRCRKGPGPRPAPGPRPIRQYHHRPSYRRRIDNYNEFANLDEIFKSIKEKQDQEDKVKNSTSSSNMIAPSYTNNPLLQ